MKWEDMKFWSSGEWDAIQEHLEDLTVVGKAYCPGKKNLFKALDEVELENVQVAIIGQDPYPNPDLATGVAFSVPMSVPVEKYPPTLVNIFKEYMSDLYLPAPTSGDLTPWCKEGVLLWNATPTCTAWKSLSHSQWPEWKLLTTEIVQVLSDKGVVFCFMGGKAREYAELVDADNSDVILTSHPSPLGARAPGGSAVPRVHSFLGSRVFSTINAKLVSSQKQEPIDWLLP